MNRPAISPATARIAELYSCQRWVRNDRDRVRALATLRALPAREQDILHERYEFPGASLSTLDEIGRRHGVSRERARQLELQALKQLRRTLELPTWLRG